MALVNLKTNLKNLPYGKDRFREGNSGQPYVQTKIPEDISSYIGTTDFLLRGGTRAVQDSIVDVERLGKMFTSTKSPNGILFIAKQQLLSRTAVRTQTSGILNEGVYTPLSTLAQAGLVAFGGHLNKQGINPFTETGAYATGKFLYFNKVKPNPNNLEDSTNNNRLVQLFDLTSNRKPGERKKGVTLNNGINVMTYTGGPGSFLGTIGFTSIKFSDQRTGINNPLYITKPGYFFGTSGKVFVPGDYLKNLYSITLNKGAFGKYSRLIGLSQLQYDVYQPYNSEGKPVGTYNNNVYEPATEGNTWPKNSPLIYENNTFTYTQEDIIQTEINKQGGGGSPKIQDFRQVLRDSLKNSSQKQKLAIESGATPFSPNYREKFNIDLRTNQGQPGQRANKSYANYTDGVINLSTNKSYYGNTTIPNIGSFTSGLDKINSVPIYRDQTASSDTNLKDLVDFRIAIIDNNSPAFKTFLHFRAFLGPMNDSYTADWPSFKYLGRGENFYTYGGFTRQISLSWTVAAQSKQELIPMYKKLNYLSSTLAPDYSPQGYMRGNLVQLTVGGYLYEQPGIITGITYEIQDDTPWEIAIKSDGDATFDTSVNQLPHIIRVSGFNFIPIQNFLPRKQELKFSPDPLESRVTDTNIGFVRDYGDQRFISLANGNLTDSNNYNEDVLQYVPEEPVTNFTLNDPINPTQELTPLNISSIGSFLPNQFINR
jgi:hypothetical protein